jgi:hypothetical protein
VTLATSFGFRPVGTLWMVPAPSFFSTLTMTIPRLTLPKTAMSTFSGSCQGKDLSICEESQTQTGESRMTGKTHELTFHPGMCFFALELGEKRNLKKFVRTWRYTWPVTNFISLKWSKEAENSK